MKAPPPVENDYDVEVEQGTTTRTLPIRAPNKAKAINQANRILGLQKVKPARVIGATEVIGARPPVRPKGKP